MGNSHPLRDKVRIGVMGSASGPLVMEPGIREKANELGREIARQKCILVNGACPGLPDDAAKGAKSENGMVIGISPAYSKEEHIEEYKSPLTADFILYTGMGFMERDIINIRTADAIMIVGGGIGSLNEFTIAYDELIPIGILTETKGVSDHIPQILRICRRELTDSIILDNDPKHLVEKMIKYLATHPSPVHEDSRVRDLGIPG